MSKRYRLFVLGAGFSHPAGLPLATELWQEILEAVDMQPGEAVRFNDDLNAYIQYRRDCDDDKEIAREDIDFEDFMKFLDIQHYLGLRGSDTWSREGNEGTIITKILIGQILASRINCPHELPELYIEFARRLQPNDTIITFNYDPLLEIALETVGMPYRLFLDRYKNIENLDIDSDREEVVVLKMHGSIDWFDRTYFDRRCKNHEKQGVPPPDDVIFSNATELGLVPLVDGPRPPNDPLKSIYRAKNLKALYSKDLLWRATPRMLSPSTSKIVYAATVGNFWEGMSHAGLMNFGMSIIGFSLPRQDDYARQIIYDMVTNYQQEQWGENILGKREKSPLVLVDFFKDADSEAKFRDRYRFVDWDRAIVIGRGFDITALDQIFA